jgi:hypothetical protein
VGSRGRRRDTAWQDVERWRVSLQSVDDVGAFQTIRRNVITADGSVELVAVAEISAAGFRVARVPPLIGRVIVDADQAPGAAPVIVIGHDVWQRRFAGARDVIGRELRLGEAVHTVVGVMPDGFQFPFNFRYWVPLQPGADEVLRNTGPEGVVFGRLAPDATLARAHAEVSALGRFQSVDARPNAGRPERAWCRTRLLSRETSIAASWACSGRWPACCSCCCCCRPARTSRS